jgi:hypothetical protein
MTLPNIVPSQYAATTGDFLKVKADRSGATRLFRGSVSVPSGTESGQIVGLIPFNKGASFRIGDKDVYCGNFGAATTTVSLGYIYDESATYTNDVDAWASAATAPQSGGFVTVDETEGLNFVAAADGWVALSINTASCDATASVFFNITGAYDGLGANNQNGQN